MGESEGLVLSQMRKSVQKLGSSAEMFGDTTLMRFLIARSMDPQKAAKMFVQWQKWRSEMVPNGFISDSEVSDELGARKFFLQGLSKDKYPVLIFKASRHFPSKDHANFKKFMVYALDKTLASAFKGREMGDEKWIAIVDMQNMAYKNIDTRGCIMGFQFLQAYYPDRLAKLYMLHMPSFFVSAWKLISHFLEKATLDKILMVSNDNKRRQFITEVGEEVIPEEYGGLAKLQAIQDVQLTPLENVSTN